MKRNKDNEAQSDTENVVFQSNGAESNNNCMRSDFDFDVNDNAPVALPRKALQPAPCERTERTLSFGEDTMLGADKALESIGTYVQEEIQPGVVLEGYAVEI